MILCQLFIFVVLTVIIQASDDGIVEQSNSRCKCVCVAEARRHENASLVKTSSHLEADLCTCEQLMNPSHVSCNLCDCKFDKRNVLVVKTVVICLIAVFSAVSCYMIILVIMDSGISKWFSWGYIVYRLKGKPGDMAQLVTNRHASTTSSYTVDEAAVEVDVQSEPRNFLSYLVQRHAQWTNKLREQRQVVYHGRVTTVSRPSPSGFRGSTAAAGAGGIE